MLFQTQNCRSPEYYDVLILVNFIINQVGGSSWSKIRRAKLAFLFFPPNTETLEELVTPLGLREGSSV